MIFTQYLPECQHLDQILGMDVSFCVTLTELKLLSFNRETQGLQLHYFNWITLPAIGLCP